MGILDALANQPLDPTAGVPQGQPWNPGQDYVNWFNNGGVSQYTGLPPASQQIWDSEAKQAALPADSPLSARMDAQKDNPLAFMAGVDMPTPKLLATIADNPLAQAIGVQHPPIVAYHGSPYSFDQFDLSKIGTGEGAQAYGHGIYLAGNEDVARSYRDNLTSAHNHSLSDGSALFPAWIAKAIGQFSAGSPEYLDEIAHQMTVLKNRQAAEAASPFARPGAYDSFLGHLARLQSGEVTIVPPGHMYEVALHADPASLLDWDKPLSAQHPNVRETALELGAPDFVQQYVSSPTGGNFRYEKGSPTGQQAYQAIVQGYGSPEAASDMLRRGIPGIRYLDGGSRKVGDGTSNYVMFDPARIQILRKYGLIPLLAGGVAAGADQQ